jgi:DNA-binding transcriptional regulator YiaG
VAKRTALEDDRSLLAMLCKRHDWTVEDVARVFCVSKRTVQRWMAGDSPIAGPAGRLVRLFAVRPEIVPFRVAGR